jgi:hypothetical protein
MQAIHAQSIALPRNYHRKPSKVLAAVGQRALADRDFTVVTAFVIIGLMASLYLVLFCPWSEEISAALSTLS